MGDGSKVGKSTKILWGRRGARGVYKKQTDENDRGSTKNKLEEAYMMAGAFMALSWPYHLAYDLVFGMVVDLDLD